MTKVFKITKERKLSAKEIFPNTSGQVQMKWLPRIYMQKIQSRLATKPIIILSLSTCKNHSINLLNSSVICEIQLV